MKYYDTHYEEYIQSVKTHNIHPELKEVFDKFPPNIKEFGNIIVYGPCGSGKYSQVLCLLEKYSPTHLKYDKRMTVNTEKQSYIYRISDIHYEIDMGLLGCHSKLLWHELFFQIVDIISMKTEKNGILVCKNFHMIHSELLEVFYSYIQHTTKLMPNMCLRFIIMTEHISFLPNNILNCCAKIAVCKPTKQNYMDILNNGPDQTHSNYVCRTETPGYHDGENAVATKECRTSRKLGRTQFERVCDSTPEEDTNPPHVSNHNTRTIQSSKRRHQ